MSPAEISRFSRDLRTLRLVRGLTQRDLADIAGLSKRTVSRLEGAYYAPTKITVVELAHALSVPETDLYPPADLWL